MINPFKNVRMHILGFRKLGDFIHVTNAWVFTSKQDCNLAAADFR